MATAMSFRDKGVYRNLYYNFRYNKMFSLSPKKANKFE